MRIEDIQLSWFRGAAEPVSLKLKCKSMVVYGANGSGKSSFVDALEYLLCDGKIRHLAHEYSGRRQEKAIPNTHRPEDRKTELQIKFKDGSELKTEINQDGFATSSGTAELTMQTWDYRRTVLRQDEVAAFISDTKGSKYSALLPLLGLDQMEVAAENLKQLAKTVEEGSKLRETKSKLAEIAMKRQATFGTNSDDQILTKIKLLHATYCPEKAETKDELRQYLELKTALDARIMSSSTEQRRHVALQDVAAINIKDNVASVRDANSKLAEAVDPMIIKKLEVLQPSRSFVDGLENEEEVKCPACGRLISAHTFKEHVMAEQERLHGIIANFDARKVVIGALSYTVRTLKSTLSKADIKSWREHHAEGFLADNFEHLDNIDTNALRKSCSEADLKAIECYLLPLIDLAASASKNAPPDAHQLSTDKQTVETSNTVIAAKDLASSAERAEALVSFIKSVEQGVREEIRLRSTAVIEEISVEVRAMWTILYPEKAIEDIRFYVPGGIDKAIDIGLKFHGVAQESPRLTLSEGYRNGLGLCIFLAMAKREAGKDRPLILDDVVVSLDRNHRGMIAELLKKEFNGRQVVILTHDRAWYTELRHQLDAKTWDFKTLLPYETPDLGIRWSHTTTTFDDARAQIEERPDSAVNDARKIMDIELALIAERLKIRLTNCFFRGVTADHIPSTLNDRKRPNSSKPANKPLSFSTVPHAGRKSGLRRLPSFSNANVAISTGNTERVKNI